MRHDLYSGSVAGLPPRHWTYFLRFSTRTETIQPVRVLRIVSVIEYQFLGIVSPPVTKAGFALPHFGTPIRPNAPAGSMRLLRFRWQQLNRIFRK